MDLSRRSFYFRWGLCTAVAALLLLPHRVEAGAQASRVGAALQGVVSDSSGAVVPGAEITLRHTSTNLTHSLRTDERGAFRAEELPVGTYEVRAELVGFAPYRHTGVVLNLGQTVHLDILLTPASATAEVTVSAQPPPIDPSQTSLVSLVERERIEELPLRSRNYLDFVLLAPGVARAPAASPASGVTPLAGSGFTFGGLRARSNNVSIDGLDNNDEYTGSSRTELSPEIVEEFQVVSNGLSAESGGVSGGSLNVITRSGTNAIHGDTFLFVQDAALNARDPIETSGGKPSYRRYRAGFALGGPIVRNRAFHYIAVEQEHVRGQNGSESEPGAAAAINAFLAAGAFPGLPVRQINTGFFPISRAETEAAAKLDHQLTKDTSLMLRYAFTNNRESSDAFHISALADASARGSGFTSDNGLFGSLTTVLGSDAVGDLRFQAATRRAVLRTNGTLGPEINIAGLLAFGRPWSGTARRRENHYQTGYTYMRARGKHLWKLGGTLNRVRLRASVADGFGGVFLFDTLNDFFAGRAAQFRQAFGEAAVDFPVTISGAFLQDHWLLAPQVTLDFGIRYDFERLPAAFNQDTNNVSPRIGLAWSPSSKWVLRAGYGVFFDRYVLANLSRALEKNGTNAFEQVADGDAAASLFAATAGGSLTAPGSETRRRSFSRIRAWLLPTASKPAREWNICWRGIFPCVRIIFSSAAASCLERATSICCLRLS